MRDELLLSRPGEAKSGPDVAVHGRVCSAQRMSDESDGRRRGAARSDVLMRYVSGWTGRMLMRAVVQSPASAAVENAMHPETRDPYLTPRPHSNGNALQARPHRSYKAPSAHVRKLWPGYVPVAAVWPAGVRLSSGRRTLPVAGQEGHRAKTGPPLGPDTEPSANLSSH